MLNERHNSEKILRFCFRSRAHSGEITFGFLNRKESTGRDKPRWSYDVEDRRTQMFHCVGNGGKEQGRSLAGVRMQVSPSPRRWPWRRLKRPCRPEPPPRRSGSGSGDHRQKPASPAAGDRGACATAVPAAAKHRR